MNVPDDHPKDLSQLTDDEINDQFGWAIEIIQRHFSIGLSALTDKDSLKKRFSDFEKEADPIYSELMQAMGDPSLAKTFISYWKVGQTLATQSRFWLEDAIAEIIRAQRDPFGEKGWEIYSQRTLSEGFPSRKVQVAYMGESVPEHLAGRKPWQVKIQKSICDAVDSIVSRQEEERPPKRDKSSRQYDLDDPTLNARDADHLKIIAESVGGPDVVARPIQCNLLVIEPSVLNQKKHLWAFRFVNRKTVASHPNRKQERANLLRLYGYLVQEQVWRNPETMSICVAEILPRSNAFDRLDPYPDYFSSLTYWDHNRFWNYIRVPFGAVTIALNRVAKQLRKELREGLRGLLPEIEGSERKPAGQESFFGRSAAAETAPLARETQPSENSKTFGNTKLDLLDMLAVVLQPGCAPWEATEILQRIKDKGFDPVELYRQAVLGRSPTWPPAPPLSLVMPSLVPSAPPSKNSTLTGEELTYLSRLAPTLQGNPSLPAVRAIVKMGLKDKVDMAKVYRVAVRSRPKWWPVAPPLADVLPASPTSSGTGTLNGMAPRAGSEPRDADINDLDDSTRADLLELGSYQYQETPDFPSWSAAMAEAGDWVQPYLASAYDFIDTVAEAMGTKPAAVPQPPTSLPNPPEEPAPNATPVSTHASITKLDKTTRANLLSFGSYQYQENRDVETWSRAMLELGDWVKPYLASAYSMIENIADAMCKKPDAAAQPPTSIPDPPEGPTPNSTPGSSHASIMGLDKETRRDLLKLGLPQYQETPDFPTWSKAMAAAVDWVQPYLASAYDYVAFAAETKKHFQVGEQCDQVNFAQGRFGYERTNPIPGHGYWYCRRLRCPHGHPYWYHRPGSLGFGPDGHTVDDIELLCFGGESRINLYFDFYHPGASSLVPEGLSMGSEAGRGTQGLSWIFPEGLDEYDQSLDQRNVE